MSTSTSADSTDAVRTDVGVSSVPGGGKLATDVHMRKLYWDWDRRITRGELNLLDGGSGVAKSTMLTDIGARITSGALLPGDRFLNRQPGWCIILSAEDDAETVVKPRLVAAGADMARTVLLDASGMDLDVDGKPIKELQLPQDVKQVEDWLKWIRHQESDAPILVVIDPLVAFISSDVNTDSDHPTRRAMRPLGRLAKRHRASIVIVRHWVKNLTGRSAATAGGGSGALFNASRAQLTVGIHPDDADLQGDDDQFDPRRRVVASGKANYGGLAPSLEFSLETIRIPMSDNPADERLIETARVEWLGETALTADQLVAALAAQQMENSGEKGGEQATWEEAADIIRQELGTGPSLANQVIKAVVLNVGCHETTIKKAASKLGILKRKERGRMNGKWYWALPEHSEALDEATKPLDY